MLDLEIIIVFSFLAFNFIPQRSHHSPTFTRSRLMDSSTVTLTPEDGTTAQHNSTTSELFSILENKLIGDADESTVISITDQFILQNRKKAQRCIGGTITVQKHCPTRFDRNCDNIDTIEPPISTDRAYTECPDG